MPREALLPGVTTSACPPPVVCDAFQEVQRARRRAYFRDALQLVVLGAVDYLFVRWPESRMPLMDRFHSMQLLGAMNAVILGHLWMSRTLPKLWARRIATTWCRSEREKFQRHSELA